MDIIKDVATTYRVERPVLLRNTLSDLEIGDVKRFEDGSYKAAVDKTNTKFPDLETVKILGKMVLGMSVLTLVLVYASTVVAAL